MAFESLSEKLQNVFKNLRSKGRLTEADVKIALKEVKLALLEADVALWSTRGTVIRDIISKNMYMVTKFAAWANPISTPSVMV